MSYTALYRKFRPDSFEDVKGQDAIVTTLKNQVRTGRIGHAYLFCGTRGTGKTTVAKILAKTVNCENPVDGSPCGECASCKAITSGTSMNVIEIDAASNNGVDNIREIREEVAYSPTEGKYKVYIIDEVHMLSIGAFNALLKTLEEPPSYVIFILATTEVHKIPITILSRCQRYDFKRISIETISARLMDLMEQEGAQVEEKAIRYVAKAADGSMRDALSLLDQCLAFYLGQKLTYENVLEVLGAVDTEVFGSLLEQIIGQDVTGVMKSIEALVMDGREMGQFVTDLIWYLRNLLLVKTSDQAGDVIDASKESLARMSEMAQKLDAETLMRYIRVLSDLSNQIRYASQKRILIEIALIKLCKPAMEKDSGSLLDRLRVVEEKLEKGVTVTAAQAPVSAQPNAQPAAVERPKPPMPKAIPEDIKQVVSNWRSIVNEASGPDKVFLKGARLSLGGGNKLQIVFENELGAAYVGSKEHKEELEALISNRIGKEVEVDMKMLDTGRSFEDSFVDLEKIIHMDITVEEE